MKITIDNLQKHVMLTTELKKLIKESITLAVEIINFNISSQVNVLLVDNKTIKKINNEHRKIDNETDVLSFPIVDIFEGVINSDEGDYDIDERNLLLGDIIISMEKTKEQAEVYGHSFERELAFLVTHGIFHLLGYDHQDDCTEKNMISLQESVLDKIGLKR